ncbi:hypothetical protein EHP00_601 [Ecytonucleospora hepatopenaei]|uniref:ABC transporter domain-containing protein n=1 Tax=Ecytonucleospora hepatopenaei TaxID=646526 RepID=A0A1W0E7Q0_9MICR|nr:hypothetical protein EHP00_601 [Ecytonucleospora hepatopenaei]
MQKVSLLEKMKTEIPHKNTCSLIWNKLFVKKGKLFKLIDSDGAVLPGKITNIICRNKEERTLLVETLSDNLDASKWNKNVELQYGYKIEYSNENVKIGVVTSKNTFLESITVQEHIKFIQNNNDFNRDIRDFYKPLLIEKKDIKIKDLSTTERILLKIAECEISMCDIIFLDLSEIEIFGLSEIVNKYLQRLCTEYNTGILFLTKEASSKYLTKIPHIILIEKGANLYQGTYQNIKKYFAEKQINYLKEYGERFQFDADESTSRCVNKILSESIPTITFLNEEYFDHKVGTELNPYIKIYESDKNKNDTFVGVNLEEKTCLEISKSFLFLLKNLFKSNFSKIQFNFNFLLPEFLYILTAFLFRFFINLIKIEDHYTGVNGLSYVNLVKSAFSKNEEIFKIKNIKGDYIDKELISDKNEILWVIFCSKMFILMLLRLLIYSCFNLNLYRARSLLLYKNYKSDVFTKKMFYKAFLTINGFKLLAGGFFDFLACRILLGGFFYVGLRLFFFVILFKVFEIQLFLGLYGIFLKIKKYKAITINISFLITKCMLLTLLLTYFLQDYKENCEISGDKRFKYFINIFYCIINPNIRNFLICSGTMLCLNLIMFVIVMKG